MPDEELPDLYRLGDLFVMPSTGEGQAVNGSLGERAKHAQAIRDSVNRWVRSSLPR